MQILLLPSSNPTNIFKMVLRGNQYHVYKPPNSKATRCDQFEDAQTHMTHDESVDSEGAEKDRHEER